MKIKELRKNNNLTQKECAKALDINANTFGRYELGTNIPTIKRLIAIADFYNVSLDYLVNKKEY